MEKQYFPIKDKEAREAGIDNSSDIKRASGFAVRLRETRGKSLSQAKAAELIGVTKSSLSLYECGDNIPDAKTIRKMAEVYGVSADYLLGLSDAKTDNKDIQAICEYTGLTEKTISALHEMSDSTGFVRCFLEALIAPGFFDNGVDAFPLEEARKYVFQAATAVKSAKQEMREFIASGAASADTSDEVYYYNRFRYDAESGRYYMDGIDAASFLLSEASAVLQEAQGDILQQIMQQIELNGIAEIKSLLPDWEEDNVK